MMEPVDFKRAYYIKLGKGGRYEQSAISESKLRIGFGRQSLEDINSGDWGKIREQLRQGQSPGVATRDLNALRSICESTSEDLWITFFQGTMWWCKLGNREIFQDDKSKYRRVDGKWSNQDIRGNILEIHNIPGVLSKTQAFRGTVCRVRQLDTLRRLVNAEPSFEYNEIAKYEIALVKSVEEGIRKLHWKDFETFVDLVFRESGWRRLSMLGGTMKFTDLELEDPITGDKYQVQIKSQATLKDFESYAKDFDRQHHRKLYFVVHSPDKKLSTVQELPQDVELILPRRLSEMVVRLGLVDWLKAHIK
jgi:hypothetical protein